MVSISSETPDQTAHKLQRVIADAEFQVLPGQWSFFETPKSAPPVLSDDTLAVVRDSDTWSVLRANNDRDSPIPRFGLCSFHFPDAEDNSGFVGWLATLLKQETGTGVFVVCGSNTGLGGIYDYWGCPIEVFDDVIVAIRALMETGPPLDTDDSHHG